MAFPEGQRGRAKAALSFADLWPTVSRLSYILTNCRVHNGHRLTSRTVCRRISAPYCVDVW
jgi:hypothetical protein